MTEWERKEDECMEYFCRGGEVEKARSRVGGGLSSIPILDNGMQY